MSTDVHTVKGHEFSDLIARETRPRVVDPKREQCHQAQPVQEYGVLQLLVMQPTSFCNLDCSYCYLPGRHKLNRMSLETVNAVFTDLMTAPFLGRTLSVVWHAGEPLAAGLQFFERALESSQRLRIRGCRVSHSIQTNATLLNEKWCQFLKQNGVRIGVSLDGPAFLHDLNRKTRTGKGTHREVMRGIEHLQSNSIDFYVLCVLTRKSLNYADELFEFFKSIGLNQLCFNIEEVEGCHTQSSLIDLGIEQVYREFFDRFYDLAQAGNIQVREFETLRRLIISGRYNRSNTQCVPFSILSVDTEGSFSSFSPELLSTHHELYGRFVFGNIHRESLLSMLESKHFRHVFRDIKSGVRRCRETCEHFVLCRGGAPSNKVFENGTFDSAETAYCRLAKKALIDVCISKIETELRLIN
jgi:uncharacterized protein